MKREQGEIVVHLFEDIYEQGAAGGIMFTWQDEWFKRTWNTMQLEDSDRRPYWSNVQTNEQRFGLLNFDTHKKNVQWRCRKMARIQNAWLIKMRAAARAVLVDDEAYLYLMVDYDPEQWNSQTDINLLMNTIEEQGNRSISFIEDLSFEEGIDFVIEISDDSENRVWVDSYYDPFYYQYGYGREFLENIEIKEIMTALSIKSV
ncbi:MAG: hypothetical protein U5K84_06300 [Alkalibacterium sp.]|nr:hypothetical protein [Alkalibacterium sp.]